MLKKLTISAQYYLVTIFIIKTKRILTTLILLSLATRLYAPLKAATKEPNQEEEKSSAAASSTYTHRSIPPSPDPTEVGAAALKQGLLKMHQEAMADTYKNTYVHGNIILYWLKQSKLILQQSEINLIIDYAQTPVYFFLGPTGAGKSTAIFALQGNEVSRDQEEESEDDNWDSESEEATSLIFNKTVQVKTPTIGHSARGETVRAIVYYPGDTTQNMAFCDTEGFSGERGDVSEAEKCISAFAPFFALKTNTIGGIVVVVSAYDILSSNGGMLLSTAHFLRHYFSSAGYTALRQSIFLMTTKLGRASIAEVARGLRGMIQTSHQLYFKALEKEAKNINNNNNKVQNKDIGDKSLAALQPFFAMLLEKPVSSGEENEIKNFRLDGKRLLFFDPCSKTSIEKTFEKLYTLQRLDSSHLFEYLRKAKQTHQSENNNGGKNKGSTKASNDKNPDAAKINLSRKGNAKLEEQQFNSPQDESSVDKERVYSTSFLII